MKTRKAIAVVLATAILVLCSITLAGRQQSKGRGDHHSFLNWFSPAHRETVTIPRGTTIHVRLEDSISSAKNTSGDRFSASLDKPLQRGSKILAPSRTKITGHLVNVKETGGARLTMVLQTLTVNGKDYALEARPLTLADPNAAIGGDERNFSARSSPGIDPTMTAEMEDILEASGAPVAYGPETRFAFTLSRELELPVYRK